MYVSRYWLWLLALAVITATPAFAAEGGKGPSEAIFIGEIVVLMLVCRMLGEAMVRLRQPAVMGQLIAGLLLGPSFFGLLFQTPSTRLSRIPEQKAMIDGSRNSASRCCFCSPEWRLTSSWCDRPAAPPYLLR
jgi:hypothetical protein